jgi:hypothetical protein
MIKQVKEDTVICISFYAGTANYQLSDLLKGQQTYTKDVYRDNDAICKEHMYGVSIIDDILNNKTLTLSNYIKKDLGIIRRKMDEQNASYFRLISD